MRLGPRPIPVELKRARGNPGRRPLPDAAAAPAKGEPICPDYITGFAKEMWVDTSNRLREMGLLGAENGPIVERYAVCFARWREAEPHLATEGSVILAPRTETPMPSPWLFIA